MPQQSRWHSSCCQRDIIIDHYYLFTVSFTLLKLEERAKAVLLYSIRNLLLYRTCKMGLEFSGVSAVKKMGEEIIIQTLLVI